MMDKFGVIQSGQTPQPTGEKKPEDSAKSAAELDDGILRDVSHRTQENLRRRSSVPKDNQPHG